MLPLVTLFLLAQAAGANDALLSRADVKKALEYIRANHEQHLAKQYTITEIPAPTFHEAERAKFMLKEFQRVGLKNVEIDKQGNVLGWRPGKSPKALVVAAHLDISFAPGVQTKIRREGQRLYAPGIGDDSRGLAAMLAIIEALNHAQIETQRTILFVANVGEEGLGDLIGIRYLFKDSPHHDKLEAFISIDGLDPGRITNGGTGVKRYRITMRGPGGHSWGNYGRPSAAHALGRAIARISAWEVPSNPRTTYNVGRIGGGTAVNAIAEESWMEVDLRSESPAELDKLEVRMFEAIRLSVEDENKHRAASNQQVKSESKLVSARPGGQTPENSAIVRAAIWASKATGHTTPRLSYSSTDSNFPISLGIPAVTLGGGGRGDNWHSLDEWFEPEGAWKGPQMVLLTVLAF